MVPQLGDKVREIVTGNEGVITGESQFLWGCRQVLMHFKDSEGKDQSEWYDEARIAVMSTGHLEAIDHSVTRPASPHRGAETPPAVR